MVLPLLSICWKEHSNTLTSVCKNLLESDFLVDCTIAAEGQSLRAHRLILSACSPYFHMLFSEERDKHPIVILKDVSFDTLKAVIDFVYHGEIQIPEKNLKTFLELAESLQIKGLNDSSIKDRCKPLSCDAVRDDLEYPYTSNQKDVCEVQNTSTNNGNVSFSELPVINHTGAVQTDAVVSYGESSTFCETVTSPVIVPSQQQNVSPLPRDLSLDAEITVKEEPLYAECAMPKYEQIDECDELMQDMHEDDSADTDEGGGPEFVEQNLAQCSSIASTYEGSVLREALMMPQTRGPPNVQRMSSAERVKKWRMKMKQNKEALEAYLEKERERSRKKREKEKQIVDKNKLELKRIRNANRVREWRKKKKEENKKNSLLETNREKRKIKENEDKSSQSLEKL